MTVLCSAFSRSKSVNVLVGTFSSQAKCEVNSGRGRWEERLRERLIDCLGGSLLKKNTTTSMNGLLLESSSSSQF